MCYNKLYKLKRDSMSGEFFKKIKTSKYYKTIIDVFYLLFLILSILYIISFNRLIIIRSFESFMSDLFSINSLRFPVFCFSFALIGFIFFCDYIACEISIIELKKTKNKKEIQKNQIVDLKFTNSFLGINKTRQLLL